MADAPSESAVTRWWPIMLRMVSGRAHRGLRHDTGGENEHQRVGIRECLAELGQHEIADDEDACGHDCGRDESPANGYADKRFDFGRVV